MKTSVIQVHDMLSVLSVDEVEQRIGEVPGVESVTVNYAAARATARYDETRLTSADIKASVRQRGHDATSPTIASEGDGHEGHAAQGAPPATPAHLPRRQLPRLHLPSPAAHHKTRPGHHKHRILPLPRRTRQPRPQTTRNATKLHRKKARRPFVWCAGVSEVDAA